MRADAWRSWTTGRLTGPGIDWSVFTEAKSALLCLGLYITDKVAEHAGRLAMFGV
jgi:hypothetical protein